MIIWFEFTHKPYVWLDFHPYASWQELMDYIEEFRERIFWLGCKGTEKIEFI